MEEYTYSGNSNRRESEKCWRNPAKDSAGLHSSFSDYWMTAQAANKKNFFPWKVWNSSVSNLSGMELTVLYFCFWTWTV